MKLMISGYLVLRLTHDEVVEDVGTVRLKSVIVVAYRRRVIRSQGAMP